MIKILHYGISENYGGIENYLYKLAQNINKYKFQFNFLDTNIGEPAFKEELLSLGCKFYKVTSRKKSYFLNKKELEELFYKEKFDILHFHVNTLSYIMPIKIARKYNCKVIIHSRNAGAALKLHTWLLHTINAYVLYDKNLKLLAVSEKAGKWLFKKNQVYEIINNGIDINKYIYNDEIRKKYRLKMGIENKKVIGVVGAFLPAKNYEFILKIYEDYKKIDKNIALFLVGDGYLRRKIEKMIEDKDMKDIYILRGRKDVNLLYNIFDIFLMPSIFEGFPNACLEAQVSGLPCVISKNITKEIGIVDVKFLELSLSSKEWAKELDKTIIKNGEERKKSAEIIRKRGFSVEREIKKIEKIYLELE